MDILSKLSERLKELISEGGKTVAEVCKDLNIDTKTFYKWWCQSSLPNLDNLIMLADYFHCSIDYLIGRTDNERSAAVYLAKLPPFHERLKLYVQKSGKSVYYLCKTAKIHKGSFTRWANGDFVPLPDNLIKLADYFECTIDQIIGREN